MNKKPESSCDTSQGLVRCMSRIPSWQAYALTLLAAFGAILFVVGGFWSMLLLHESPPAAHPATVLMIGGGVCIAMLLPLSFIIYLAKELMSLRARLDQAENSARQAARGDADLPGADEGHSA